MFISDENSQSSPSKSPGGTNAVTETPSVNHSTQNQNVQHVANDSLVEGASLVPRETEEGATDTNSSNNTANIDRSKENSESIESKETTNLEKSPQKDSQDSKTELKEEAKESTSESPSGETSKQAEEDEGAAAATTPTSECSSKGIRLCMYFWIDCVHIHFWV